jgi:hypothetical protein
MHRDHSPAGESAQETMMLSERDTVRAAFVFGALLLSLCGLGCPMTDPEPIAGSGGTGTSGAGGDPQGSDGGTTTGGVSGFIGGSVGGGPSQGTDDGTSGITGRGGAGASGSDDN